jgi:FAD/FMN-containing dehydrogenase
MAGDMLELAVSQLAALSGAENVLETGAAVLVKPFSAGEVAGIMDIARKAGIPVTVRKYVVGPAPSCGDGPRIEVSLERMSGISVDPGGHSMLAGPAAETGEVIKTALERGLVFPGGDCLHRGATIGENIVECFEEGEPHFKCRTACLCGLEMVLADGRQVMVGESGIKDLDNYHLSFLLSGYRESTAVITGLHLKMVPAQKGFSLVAAAVDLNKTMESLGLFLEEFPFDLQEMYLLNNTLCLNTPAGFKFHHLGGESACLLLRTEGDHASLELIMDLINRHCGPEENIEAYVAGDSYQRAVLLEALEALFRHFEENPGYIPESFPENVVGVIMQPVEQLAALTWKKGRGLSGIFYRGQN